MPHSVSAKKRVRQTESRRLRNRAAMHALRGEIRKFNAAVSAGNAEQAGKEMVALSQRLDKLVTKGLVHKNQAARRKSRMTAKVKALRPATA